MSQWRWRADRTPGQDDGNESPGGPSTQVAAPGRRSARLGEELEQLVYRFHQRLIDELEAEKLESMPPDKRREAVQEAVKALLARESLNALVRDAVATRVVDEVVGLGPLEPLLHDSSISEVMVNAPDEVYFERDGIMYQSDVRFRDSDHVMQIVERIIAPLGRRVDESSPMVDARLADGSRVNVIIPPLAPKSPTMTIRKFLRSKLTMDDLVGVGTLSTEVGQFMGACAELRLNVLISGGTGTGKTTLLNALSAYIPDSERIVSIEDPLELQLQQPHVISLEARPPNVDGRGEVTQRELLRNALRMRPDRILIGEVRGGEAFDMLNAMNTGHEGSLSTIHANSPRDALARLENMVLMANLDLPVRAIREQMSSALHLVLQIARFRDGGRRITHITEVSGMEGDIVTLQDIFHFEQEGIDEHGRIIGRLEATGIRPTFAEGFAQAGISLPEGLFKNIPEW
ncbi:MAG: CpaF family protein [Dehalococcoidia bacterium]|nr:MAG: CpaF family protein [Dehalococcoidia bacterium]